METLEAIRQRRAVKHYDNEHQLTPEEEKQLFESTMLAPTAFNIQNWRFVAVRDPELRKQIRAVAWDQAQVTDSSLLVILCADKKAWEKNPERYWKDAPQEVQDIIVPAIDGYYRDRPQVQQDECMRSCGMAGMALMLTAKDMGYDSCPMDGFDFEAVGKLLNLPEDHVISFMVAIGKGTEPAKPKSGQLSYDEVVISDRF
ncbi:nitroreductase family protein [Puniceicoccus vermicola]|uniref:Nitroreductase family protein n=1 Tax=Puniceicoccus vermicola TaxID=388746 RepID=A0A7X1B136_9BACT|nr:nitroreductase family protein [Puniceicoccus vermicola]MBC2603698.1 nitroreductase family protein [Puniceicoccus vermicola]